MHILKVYKNKVEAEQELDNYVSTVPAEVDSISMKNLYVSLRSGDTVYFRAVNSLADCHKLGGMVLTKVEVYPGILDEYSDWLRSRLRDEGCDDNVTIRGEE